jgi:membrane fusion protein, multidrug efflux system
MRGLILAAITCAGLIGAVPFAMAEEAESTAPMVRPVLYEIASRTPPQTMRFVGVVTARESTRYAFRVGGRMVLRNVSVGDAVTGREFLARLDTTLLELAVDNAEANLAIARAQHDNAVTAAARVQALFDSNSAPRASRDRAAEQAAAAQSGVAQAEAQLTQAQDQLDQAQLVARSAGVVTEVSAQAGQLVAAGQPVLTIANPDVRDVVINVPEEVAGQLQPGMQAQVWPQLDADNKVTGTLREIAPEANSVTRQWQVKIGIEKPPHSLWLGTTAEVDFGSTGLGLVTVPDSAILRRDDEVSLWIIDPESESVTRRAVTLGAGQGGRTAITEGLEPGEYVAIAGVHVLQDGQNVRLEGQEQ